VTLNEWLRTWFTLAFIILVSAAFGAIIDGQDPPRGYEAGAALLIALGIGVGLWTFADWRSSTKQHRETKGDAVQREKEPEDDGL
jgi:hypothetical protein